MRLPDDPPQYVLKLPPAEGRDYGKNDKGFYNDIFAPGRTVASLWQMLSPERVSDFFARMLAEAGFGKITVRALR